MENNSLAFLTSLGGKLSGKEAGGAKLTANAEISEPDRNGFFAILNRLLTPNGNTNETVPGLLQGLAGQAQIDGLNGEENLDGLETALAAANGELATVTDDIAAAGNLPGLAQAAGEAPVINVSNAGDGALGKTPALKINAAGGNNANAAEAMKAAQAAPLGADEKAAFDPGAGPRSGNANEQSFLAPRQGLNKPTLQGQNPVAAAAKTLGETMKAEHALAAPAADVDVSSVERATARAEIVSLAADKTVSINPVRDQVVAALVSRHSEGRLEVRLDPPELGRVMIRFEGDGGELVRAVISADTPETLDLMRRNADAFQKSLTEQGFEGLDLEFAEHGAKDASDEEFEAGKTFIAANEIERAAGPEEHEPAGRMVALGRLDARF